MFIDTTTVEYIIVTAGLIVAGIIIYNKRFSKPVRLVRDKWGYCRCCRENRMGPKFCRVCGMALTEKRYKTGACPVCGKAPGNMRYCMHCGSSVAFAYVSDKEQCASCGANVRGRKICPECGISVIEAKPREYKPFKTHKRVFMIDKDFYDDEDKKS